MNNCKRDKNDLKLLGSGIKRSLINEDDNTMLKKFKSSEFRIETVKTAFKNAAITWKLVYDQYEDKDIIQILHGSVLSIENNLLKYRKSKNALKFNVALHAVFEKAADSSILTEPPVCLVSEPFEVYADTSVKFCLERAFNQLLNFIEVYERNGSGWILSYLEALDITVWELDPLRASSYHKLPAWIVSKRAVTNVKNTGNDCFKWAFLAGMHPISINSERMSKYVEFEKEYDFTSLHYPVPLKEIDTFCRRNNCSVNVYGISDENNKNDNIFQNGDEFLGDDISDEDSFVPTNCVKEEKKQGAVYPLKVTKIVKERHVNLLLTEKDGQHHYSTIKDFSRLVRSQVSRREHQHFFCYSCMHGFISKNLLKSHREISCKTSEAQRTMMPTKDPILQFKNIQKQVKSPFVAYADFECLLEEKFRGDNKVETNTYVSKIKSNDTPSNNGDTMKKTNIYQEHVPCSFAFKIVSVDSAYDPEIVIFKGKNAAEKFIEVLQQKASEIYDLYIKNPKPMPTLTAEEKRIFSQAETCHICKEPLGDDRVRDHCHILGGFRGAAHSICNLQYQIKPKNWKLPVVIHNLRGYDGHLIVKVLKKKHGKTRVIANNMETYMSFSAGKLQFLDSFQFTNKPLDDLVKTLSSQEFIHTSKAFPKKDELKLVQQKGVYMYDYMDSFDRFHETKLPDKKYFFNRLSDKNITDEQYDHALCVWDAFQCRTIEDYHNIYLKSDILLLTDFFEKFRESCFQNYDLDPLHYYTAPGLAWDAALKKSKVKLELITDVDMYSFIENAIRGGISMISNRYARSNNKYNTYFKENSEEQKSHLLYLDANNLYGWSMIQCLPTGGFKFLTDEEIVLTFPIDDINNRLSSLSDNAECGYIFEVDLEYPTKLHDYHNDYPLAPETLEISNDMLSPFQKETFPDGPPQLKLTPNLKNKSRYVVHYRNLKLYTELGLVVTKVHRVLKFKQSPWLESYINFNTQQRSLSTSIFEKDFFKLMNNSVFGKTQENLRKRINVELITDEKILKKRVANPGFKCGNIITEDLTIVQSRITTLVLNRPIYIGFTVLDLSKLHMYDFHYNYIKLKYPDEKSKLMFTDTDSLTYLIKTDDVYEDMLNDNHLFDFSDYPDDHPCFQSLNQIEIQNIKKKNKKIIGKFKDELKGISMEEYVGLRPKLYSILYMATKLYEIIKGKEMEIKVPTEFSYSKNVEMEDKKTAKGTKESVKKEHMKHCHYKDTLFTLGEYIVSQNLLKSENHTITSRNIKKIALSGFDTKRWLLNDKISTRAHGHYLNI